MISKVEYELARASGTLELLRDDKISALVRKKYTLGAETRLLCNLMKAPNDIVHIEKFEAHERYVEECEAKVDVELLDCERRYSRDNVHNT